MGEKVAGSNTLAAGENTLGVTVLSCSRLSLLKVMYTGVEFIKKTKSQRNESI